jgi:arylsulfatase A-like enzyme
MKEKNWMPKKIILWGLPVIITILIFFFLLTFAKPKPPKNVIFIMLDALRADHLGCYGYERNTSHTIDTLANSGILFETCFSQAGWTCPSIASFFTSMYPDFHKTVIFENKLNSNLLKISSILKSSGYFSAGASTNVGISEKSGFSDGFDAWAEGFDDVRLTRWAQSFLEKDGINFDLIKRHNLVKDGSFLKEETFGAVKEFGSVIPGIYGYIDYTCLRLRMRPLLNNKPVTIAQGIHIDKTGEYAWGAAVRTEKMSEPVTLELMAVKNGKDLYRIDSRTIPAGLDWNLYKFKTKIKEKADIQIRISAPFEWVEYPDKSFKLIFIDEIFLIPFNGTLRNKPQYLYLHYMATHAPHMVQDEAKGQFFGKFTDSILPKQSILNDRGDRLGMNDHKFILQSQNALDWVKENDDINWHNNRYDEEILFLDAEIEKLVNLLKRTGEFDDTLLIIAADHGEEYLDHGFISHSQSLYNELLHIPLILIYPNGWEGGTKISQMVQSVDLMPTLLDLVAAPEPTKKLALRQISGKSLLPMMMGRKDSEKRISYSSDYISKQTSAIFDGYKYILKDGDCFKKELLFNIKKDFSERRDIQNEDPKRLSDFRLIINTYKEKAGKINLVTSGQSDFNSAQMQMIRGLGYVTRNDVTMRGFDGDCFLLWMRFVLNHLCIVS